MPVTYTLIASLGTSPGAVTGLYHAIRKEHPAYDIERIRVLRTTDRNVEKSWNIVREFLSASADVPVEAIVIPEDEPFSLDVVQKMVSDSIAESGQSGPVMLGITGGRTSMGAILALAAQLYPDIVSHTFNLWVKNKIQQDGELDKLQSLRSRDRDRYSKTLNPTKDRNDFRLLSLPFMVANAELVRTERESIEAQPTLELAQTIDTRMIDHLDNILALLPRRMTIAQARELMQIARDLKRGIPLPGDALTNVLQAAGVNEADGAVKLLSTLSQRPGDAKALAEEWIRQQEGQGYYWARNLMDTYRRHRDDFSLGISVTALVVELIALHFQVASMAMLP